ncbi:hypothetical protein [Moraxella equi]|uniref:Uncharacterized protein n=1 Tax=Moraxella equi TaxID=60442 RepID=A0A378QT42_9GAMM|nr:hypothetical protein [Moraxella equi]STZ03590.1 Uncharacterised protein [Moraxella equi]
MLGGGNVWTCKNNVIHAHEGNSYLEKYGLPLEIGGNFICDGDTPKLPKDCQGREFRSEAELRVYWEKHQLPVGYVWWECHNGIPKVAPSSIKGWSQMESANPTCKDSRGHKRPCV